VYAAVLGFAIGIQNATRTVWEVTLAVERVDDGLAGHFIAGSVARGVRATLTVASLATNPARFGLVGDRLCVDERQDIARGAARTHRISGRAGFEQPRSKLVVALGASRTADRIAVVVKLACAPEVGAGRVRVGILVAKGHRAEALAHTLHRVVRNPLAHLRIVGDVIACILERSDELLCAAPIGVSRGRFSIGATRIKTLSPLVIRGNFANAGRTPGVGALRHLRWAVAVLQAEPLATSHCRRAMKNVYP